MHVQLNSLRDIERKKKAVTNIATLFRNKSTSSGALLRLQ